jgi:hypothetical protein
MNLFCRYREAAWRLILIPRLAHRPRQYYSEGDEHVLTSPGAADVGGLFITPLEKDYEKMDAELLRDICGQIVPDGAAIGRMAGRLREQADSRPSS